MVQLCCKAVAVDSIECRCMRVNRGVCATILTRRYFPPAEWPIRAQELQAQRQAAAAERSARRVRAAKPGHQAVLDALRDEGNPVDLTSGSPRKRRRRVSARDASGHASAAEEGDTPGASQQDGLLGVTTTAARSTVTPAARFYGSGIPDDAMDVDASGSSQPLSITMSDANEAAGSGDSEGDMVPARCAVLFEWPRTGEQAWYQGTETGGSQGAQAEAGAAVGASAPAHGRAFRLGRHARLGLCARLAKAADVCTAVAAALFPRGPRRQDGHGSGRAWQSKCCSCPVGV